MLPQTFVDITFLWISAVYFISPILNIRYLSKRVKNEKYGKLIRIIGGTFYAFSLLLMLFWFLSELLDWRSFGDTIGALFFEWSVATALVSPLINVFFRIRNSATLSLKVLFGVIGIMSYVILLMLLYLTFFVSA